MSNPSRHNGRRLVFTGRQQVDLEEFAVAEPKEDEVLVRTAVSLMSTGTENIVFNRLFDPGTHWDNWVRYPFYPGYSAVGTVEAVGSAVKAFAPGQHVAGRCAHSSHMVMKDRDCIAIADGISFEDAAWFALAKIAFNGAWVADYTLGDSVLIIGAGPIGQMSIRWARASGVGTIISLDPVEQRLALARAGGATAAISLPIADATSAVLEANRGRRPRVVIDSTGNAAVFAAALGLVEDHGTVVVLGDTGSPAQQRLTGDVITRGLKIVGAHDGHQFGSWTNSTVTELFISLAMSGRFSLEGLNKHRFTPRQCRDAYRLANEDRANTMGILFTWDK